LLGAAVLLSAGTPVRLSAQDSQFGVRGLGTPGRFETARARSTGGAFGPFDALSPLTEASLGDLQQLAATAMGGTSYRQADVAGGAAVHVLSGSTRETAGRTFDDTTYHAIRQNDETRYDGLGISGSLLVDPLPALRLSLFARSDNRLRARLGDVVTAETNLPNTFGAGLRWAASPSLRARLLPPTAPPCSPTRPRPTCRW